MKFFAKEVKEYLEEEYNVGNIFLLTEEKIGDRLKGVGFYPCTCSLVPPGGNVEHKGIRLIYGRECIG
jgi:hypothetical protein